MPEGKVEDSVKTVAEVVSGVLEKAPVYEDAAQPALREIGQGLEGMLKMVVLPLKMGGYAADKYFERFKERFDDKGQTIPKEDLQVPDPMIAGPIIQSLGYTIHDDSLREMFTNLLVTNMNSSRIGGSHRAFVKIIEEVSPDEAKILRLMLKSAIVGIEWSEDMKIKRVYLDDNVIRFPIIDIVRRFPSSNGTSPFRRHVCLLAQAAGCGFVDEEAKYIDNLARLGIIGVHYDKWLTDNMKYYGLEEKFKKLREDFKRYADETLDWQKGIIEVTEFGKKFMASCVLDVSEIKNQRGLSTPSTSSRLRAQLMSEWLLP